MDSSDALRHYTDERLGKIKRYFSEPLKVNCTFEVEKITHVAQFDVTLRNGLKLHSSETTENMYSSIDMALAKMERQVRRYKDRITSHKQVKGKASNIRQIEFTENEPAPRLDQGHSGATSMAAEEVIEAELGVQIVREKEYSADRLSINQAIMQMNLLHRSFHVFTNVATDAVNVVYRIAEDKYGLIETQGVVHGEHRHEHG